MRDDIPALLFDRLRVDIKTAVAVGEQRRVKLAFARKAHHQRRDAKRQRFIAVGVPGMPGFAVGVDDFAHQRLIRQRGQSRRNEAAGLHLILVAVPEFFLLRRQGVKQPLADDVLHAHQPGIFGIAVIDDRLHDVFV